MRFFGKNHRGYRFCAVAKTGEMKNGKSVYWVVFPDSGTWVKATSNQLYTRYIRDTGRRDYLGVANGSSPKTWDGTIVWHFRAKSTWQAMVGRCYNAATAAYPAYGGRGVRVCDRWLDFSSFWSDLPSLDGFDAWRDGSTCYELDKDEAGANLYGPDTCRLIPRAENRERGRRPGGEKSIAQKVRQVGGSVQAEYQRRHRAKQGRPTRYWRGRPITVGPVTYLNIEHACRALGRSRNTLLAWVRRGDAVFPRDAVS